MISATTNDTLGRIHVAEVIQPSPQSNQSTFDMLDAQHVVSTLALAL